MRTRHRNEVDVQRLVQDADARDAVEPDARAELRAGLDAEGAHEVRGGAEIAAAREGVVHRSVDEVERGERADDDAVGPRCELVADQETAAERIGAVAELVREDVCRCQPFGRAHLAPVLNEFAAKVEAAEAAVWVGGQGTGRNSVLSSSWLPGSD